MPRDNFTRALQANNPYIDQFDIDYVAERYPKLRKPGSKWLCQRFGRAITKRRQLLHYSREHSKSIASPDSDDIGTAKSTLPVEMGVKDETAHIKQNNQLNLSSGSELNDSVAALDIVSTETSILDITRAQKPEKYDANEEGSRSLLSATSSLEWENEDSKTHLPLLENLIKNNPIFQCPFCSNYQSFTRQSEWRRHAYSDLKAYVCSLGEGTCDSELFGDSRSWFDHELALFAVPKNWDHHILEQGTNQMINVGGIAPSPPVPQESSFAPTSKEDYSMLSQQQLQSRHLYPPTSPIDLHPPCDTLYVGNLPIDISEEELKSLFSQQRGYRRFIFRTKRNGPMCFVQFEDIKSATQALHALNGKTVCDSSKGGIRISFSKNPLGVRSVRQSISPELEKERSGRRFGDLHEIPLGENFHQELVPPEGVKESNMYNIYRRDLEQPQTTDHGEFVHKYGQ
ncbi:hypothetical protein F5Y16DRAFT_393109 [Xylariaceae sp. FL0255]|nr:hypothetical protein F5Y16DRAFT_393109 [Xylariaceae sp. FL0255]